MYSKEPEKSKAAPGETPKVKLRLPKLGCFSLFFIFFFGTFLLGMLVFQTVLARPVVCETPDPGEPVVIYDPCGVLLKEEVEPLYELATEVAEAGDCNVAVMFVDEHFTNFQALSDSVLADWKPDKGVLLMFGLNNGSVRMSITGEGWRLASWDQLKFREDVRNRVSCYRGEAATILLTEFKRSLETAAAGDLPEAEVGQFSGTFFSTGREQDRAQYTAGVCGIFAGAVALLIGWLLLRNGKSIIRTLPERNRAVQEEFDAQSPEHPNIELRDANVPRRKSLLPGCLHHPALQILAIASGTLIGFGGMATVWTEDPDPDSGSEADFGELVFKADDRIPAAPTGVVSDLANVFSEDEEQMLAQAVRQLESATGGQVRILTVETIGDAPLEEYTLDVASKWKIGRAGLDNGALVFFAIRDHRSRIEVGYGWEERLNDARCGDLLRAIAPEMRAEKYAEGCAEVIRGMEEFLTGEQDLSEDGVRKVSESKPPKSTILVYPPVIHAAPAYDPRTPGPLEPLLGLLGTVCLLLGIAMGYRGRVLATALPRYYIYDPDSYHASDDNDYDSSDYSSSDYDSSSSDSDGGGSFGGGGASGSW